MRSGPESLSHRKKISKALIRYNRNKRRRLRDVVSQDVKKVKEPVSYGAYLDSDSKMMLVAIDGFEVEIKIRRKK